MLLSLSPWRLAYSKLLFFIPPLSKVLNRQKKNRDNLSFHIQD